MAEMKYGHLLKGLTFSDYGPGFYRQGTTMTGEFLGFDAHIEYGTYWSAGRIGKEPFATEVHDFDQVMVFMGAETSDPGYLGAEIEFCLGEEKETHMITTSTAVAIPKGLPHLPVTITRMDKRFILMTVSCSPELTATLLPSDKKPSEPVGWQSKYRNYISPLAFIRNGPWHYGPLNRDTNDGYITNIVGKDFDFHMSYETVRKAPYRAGPVPDKPHVHPYTEFLVFMGADCNDLSEFGGEIEFSEGEEMERHIFTTPTVAICPKDHPHCPITTTKIHKPLIVAVVRPFGQGVPPAREP